MTPIEHIRLFHDELTAWRRDLHAHPELGFGERRTAAFVADTLRSLGAEVHEGVGGTGVVGVLRGGNGSGSIGLRADMDALPITEATGLPYQSGTPGVMHACGHDGHTTMLLGAARYLAQTRRFDGTVHFIFQPAEEGLGGAEAMLRDGLFDRFGCDTVFGLHNSPGMPVGHFALRPGAMMAGGAFFDLVVTGRGSHGAAPAGGIDPVLAGCAIVSGAQSIVSRNVRPTDTAVLSITRFSGGDAYNVIPQSVTLGGTARAFEAATMTLIESNLRRMAEGVAAGFGASASLDFRTIFAPLVNDPEQAAIAGDVAASLVGEAAVERNWTPVMGSEDFSFMLQRRPGAYLRVGNGQTAAGCGLHNPGYDFNDEAIPFGAGLLAALVERKLPRGAES